MNEEMDFIEKIVQESLNNLSEHCDSVMIFVTKHGDGSSSNTAAFSEGRGNFYAQYGQIKEWVARQDERVRIDTRNFESENGDESL